jgi:hypothetical protein
MGIVTAREAAQAHDLLAKTQRTGAGLEKLPTFWR